MLAGLHHAFPDRSESWRRSIAKRSVSQTLESALLIIALPGMKKEAVRERFSIDPLPQEALTTLKEGQPIIVLLPHAGLIECSMLMPFLSDHKLPPIGALYRPFKNPSLEAWVKKARSAYGAEMLSRKQGYFRAKDILQHGGILVTLFDQNAGIHGSMSLFMERICSTTVLPDKLATHTGARCFCLHARRTGFWRASLNVQPLTGSEQKPVLVRANQWLEGLLRSDDVTCASWLWAHKRWKFQDTPAERLRLKARQSSLEHYPEIPRKLRLWIRMPNWLGDVIMAIPLIRAIRSSRPDAAICLLAKPHLLPLLHRFNLAEELRALPEGIERWRTLARWRRDYPDIQILLTNSTRGDLEARLIGAPQRFGMLRPNKHRPLLTHCWQVPEQLDERLKHQMDVWERFLKHFGLACPPDRTALYPSPIRPEKAALRLGLICGTENNPEKRWPVPHWRTLLDTLLGKEHIASIELLGTARDRLITDAVAEGFSDQRLSNRAGETDLEGFCESLRALDLLICNDTGGMHLANALGVPVLALFGPTNPVRTGPVFDAPTTLLQPPGCPATGGASLNELAPAQVIKALERLLAERSGV